MNFFFSPVEGNNRPFRVRAPGKIADRHFRKLDFARDEFDF